MFVPKVSKKAIKVALCVRATRSLVSRALQSDKSHTKSIDFALNVNHAAQHPKSVRLSRKTPPVAGGFFDVKNLRRAGNFA